MYEFINSVIYCLQICPKEIIRRVMRNVYMVLHDSSDWKPPKYPVVGDLLNKWILLFDGLVGSHLKHFFKLIFKDFGKNQ